MKLSKASSYAQHSLMYMVRHLTLLPLSKKVIARSEGIPSGYASKIFNRLQDANIIERDNKGEGGYSFTRPPEEITVLEILEAIEGRDFLSECFMKHCKCGGTPATCEIYRVWQESTRELKNCLARISLTQAAWSHPQHYFDKNQSGISKTAADKSLSDSVGLTGDF